MSWLNHYVPPTPQPWHGRADAPEASSFFQIIQLLDLRQTIPANKQNNKFALLGFCCDEGIRRNLGRTGAAQGPSAIREMLAKYPYRKIIPLLRRGDIICIDSDLEDAQHALAQLLPYYYKHNITPLVLGGGHEIAWVIIKVLPHNFRVKN